MREGMRPPLARAPAGTLPAPQPERHLPRRGDSLHPDAYTSIRGGEGTKKKDRRPVRWQLTHADGLAHVLRVHHLLVTQNDKDGAGPDTVTTTRGGCPTISPTVCVLNNKCGHATLRQAEPKPTPTATPTRRWRPCRLPATDTGLLTYVIMETNNGAPRHQPRDIDAGAHTNADADITKHQYHDFRPNTA